MAGGGGTGGRQLLQATKVSASFARRRTDITNSDCSTSTKASAQRRVRPSSAPLLGFGNGPPVPPDPPPQSQDDLSGSSSTLSLGSHGHHRCCTDITLLDGVSPYYSYTNFDSSAETVNRTRQRHNFMHRSLHGNFHSEVKDSTFIAQHLDSTFVGTLLGSSCCAGILQRHRHERSLLGDLQLDLSRTGKFQDSEEHVAEAAPTPSTISAATSRGTTEAPFAAHANPKENHIRPGRSSGNGGNNARPASRPGRAHDAASTTAAQRPKTAGRLQRPASAASVRSNSNNATPKAAAARAAAASTSAARNTVTGLPQHMQVRSMSGNSGTVSTTASVSLLPDVGIKGLLRRGGGPPARCEQRKPDQRRISGGATRSRAQARREKPRGMTHCSSAPCLSVL